jgi:hypothetical protein
MTKRLSKSPESFLPLTPVAFEILLALGEGGRHGYEVMREIWHRRRHRDRFHRASLIKGTEFPGSETDLSLQGMAMIISYGIVMLGVCMLGCVVPTRRALNFEPTIALRTE